MEPETQVWLNGRFIPWKDATVPILSHSFARASAVFEIFRVHNGPNGPAVFRMDAHLDRLRRSAGLLDMPLVYSTHDIARAVTEIVLRNGVRAGVVKIMAYWSEVALIRLLPLEAPDLAIFAIPETPEMDLDSREPITACISKWRKIDPLSMPVEAKACANYLNAYLARKDAVARGYDMGILLGRDGSVAEGSTESVFIVRNGVLKTPAPGNILPSVTRMSVLEAAADLGIEIAQQPLNLQDLCDADEMFLSHTGVKVQAVRQFEDRCKEAPGPVTLALRRKMMRILDFQDKAYSRWMQTLGA